VFSRPFRGATSLAVLVAAFFSFSAVALSYDGLRLRMPAAEQVVDETVTIDISSGLERFNAGEEIAMEMGAVSPGRVIFSHTRHIDPGRPDCTACHSGQFRMIKNGPDITPFRKMQNCGDCHNGIKAIAVADKNRCYVCHGSQGSQ
jgi:c(7)-type cytochrome triheme protein